MSKNGLLYIPQYVTPAQKQQILQDLKRLYFPIWEKRFSEHNPPPEGSAQRWLLRPVYWLGNWQFACLNYYHPPKGIEYRCVQAEPFPPLLQRLVDDIESRVRNQFPEKDVPRQWHLNTCLINYYGSQLVRGNDLSAGNTDRQVGRAAAEDESDTALSKDSLSRALVPKLDDRARVGEHKDFEPGPVASISFGEKALFQFVRSEGKNKKSEVVLQQWLEDSSLQIFGGDRLKKALFHRVQRVEDKSKKVFDVNTGDFLTRRINFTFRYVPTDHVQPLARFPSNARSDVREYVEQLSSTSQFFANLKEEIYSGN
jgi:alkylated DNA repair dioxygenase AlkB